MNIFNNKLLLSGLLLLSALPWLPAQKLSKGYYFDGDDVVFEFDIRLYQKAEADGTLQKLEFSDLNINKVVVTGNFDKWSEKAWRMKKTGPYTYQLRKKVSDFNDDFTWEFKFLINGKYIADPKKYDVREKILSADIWEGVYDLDVYNVKQVEHGNASFFLKGYPDAKEVILAGSFNGWKEHGLKMKKVSGGWGMELQLPVGRFEYKFIVDGEWMHDPANPDKVVNEYDTFNSVMVVVKPVFFELEGFTDAKEVILAGTFNNWDPNAMKMDRTPTGWKKILNLPGGKVYYKFIIDGKWMTDPGNPLSEYDRSGNLNSVLLVR